VRWAERYGRYIDGVRRYIEVAMDEYGRGVVRQDSCAGERHLLADETVRLCVIRRPLLARQLCRLRGAVDGGRGGHSQVGRLGMDVRRDKDALEGDSKGA
jgi:hypothetical protein